MKLDLRLFDIHFLALSLALLVLASLVIGATFHLRASAGDLITKSRQGKSREPKVIFYTTDDDKENGTSLSVYIQRPDGKVVAEIEDIRDYFGKGSRQEYLLKLPSGYIPPDVQKGTVTIRIKPGSRDIWKFDFNIELTFSDGRPYGKKFPGNMLSEKSTEITLPLE